MKGVYKDGQVPSMDGAHRYQTQPFSHSNSSEASQDIITPFSLLPSYHSINTTMSQPTRPPRNTFNARIRKLYNPLGFTRAYNFILWFIFAGALFGFALSRMMYLNFYGVFCSRNPSPGNSAAPGECYYYLNFDQYKIGIILHLATILPAGLLVVLQFTPAIRHKAILFHRVNGYVVLLLYALSTAGAFMIMRHAFGGGLDTQAGLGTIGIASVVAFVISYVNIKRLQIEQHRAWMLRGWFYVSASFILIERRIF